MGLGWIPLNKRKSDDVGVGKHGAVQVANKLIELANAAGSSLTPMQVIKLTYFCHAWMLGLYGRPLLNTPVEAWKYGPVFLGVYRALRQYGSGPVKPIPRVQEGDFDAVELEVIRLVHDEYGDMTGIRLSALTHASGTPWHQVWESRKPFGRTTYIPDDKIRDYYQSLVEKESAQTLARGRDGR